MAAQASKGAVIDWNRAPTHSPDAASIRERGYIGGLLSLIERGKNAPSFETLDKIAKRLRVSVADLFTFKSGAKRP